MLSYHWTVWTKLTSFSTSCHLSQADPPIGIKAPPRLWELSNTALCVYVYMPPRKCTHQLAIAFTKVRSESYCNLAVLLVCFLENPHRLASFFFLSFCWYNLNRKQCSNLKKYNLNGFTYMPHRYLPGYHHPKNAGQWLANSGFLPAKFGPCLFLYSLQTQNGFTFLNGFLKIKKRQTSPDMKMVWNANFWAINKVLLEYSHTHLFS